MRTAGKPHVIEQKRNRIGYSVAVLGVILIGLASRQFPWLFPPVLGKYPGDALWAMMVFLGLAVLRPTWRTTHLAMSALVIAFAVEYSQILDWPWLVALRSHRLGHLVLGSTFNPGDLLAYAVGVACGAFTDWMRIRGWMRLQ